MWITRKHLNELITEKLEQQRSTQYMHERIDDLDRLMWKLNDELTKRVDGIDARLSAIEHELGV